MTRQPDDVYQHLFFQQKIASSFDRACDSYFQAARLQQQVALDALSMFEADGQGQLLDLGCGPGWIHNRLSRYCQGFYAADLSAAMLQKAAQQQLANGYVQADAANLPLQNAQFDKIFSSLMLQWCASPQQVLSEINRLLAPKGQVLITTLVEGTLDELRQAFAALDSHQHVNQFSTADNLIQLCQQQAGMRWQFQQRCYPLFYPDVTSLARELKDLGANQLQRRQSLGLTGKGYWQKLAAAYDVHRTMLGLPANYQVLFMLGQKL